MATFAETLDKYKAEMDSLGISYDEALLSAVAKGLGPAIYNDDSSRVSSSDPDELAQEIVENLEAGLESFRAIIESLNKKK